MARGIANVVASYLEDLTATHSICSALGTTLTFGSNMFLVGNVATTANAISIIPYGGSPPNVDGNRQEANIQIRSRTSSRYKALEVQQSLINTLHMNELNGNGLVQAIQSNPIILDTELGGRYTIAVSNYRIKHIKV